MATSHQDIPLPSEALLERYDVAGPRYTSYPTVPSWRSDFGAEHLSERLGEAAAAGPQVPLSLYVHLPFCQRLCWYCGCNVTVAREQSVADRYIDHVLLELEQVVERLGARRSLAQVHWGGGTPTFLSEPQLERLWRGLMRHLTLLPEAEVAVEVHPAITTPSQLALLRQLGFNRLSLGLQDFDPLVQHATGRLQTYEQTARLLQQARELGFGGLNVDLIYGLPYQEPESWARTLAQVVALRPDRLAVYSFAWLPEVLKHQRRLPAAALPTRRTKLELFRQAWATLVGAGWLPIGMDHFALPEDELARAQARRALGRNFQGYTVRAAPDVVALGASSISDVGGAYAQNVRNLPRYYERVRAGRLATERGLRLSEEDRRRRAIITELMCHFEVDLGEQAHRYAHELERLAPLEEDGLVRREGSRVRVTPLGRLFVRNVAMAFDAYLASGSGRFSRTV